MYGVVSSLLSRITAKCWTYGGGLVLVCALLTVALVLPRVARALVMSLNWRPPLPLKVMLTTLPRPWVSTSAVAFLTSLPRRIMFWSLGKRNRYQTFPEVTPLGWPMQPLE